MSDSDVPKREMDDNWFSDAEAESILSNAPSSDSSELQQLVGDLRDAFSTPTDIPAGEMLQEYLTVIDLTTTTGTPTGKTRSKKLITGLGTFIATATGKVVLGTAVAAASVSGAHAADLVDIPLLPDNPPAEVQEELDLVEEELDLVEEEVVEEELVEDSVGEDALEELAFTNDEEEDDNLADDDEDEQQDDEVADDEDDENHGQVVSEFARSTDLEGCEKGRAISELARSKSDPDSDDQDSDDPDSDDPDSDSDDTLSDEEGDHHKSKCHSSDEVDRDDVAAPDDDDDEHEDGNREKKSHDKDNGKGKGKAHKASDDHDDDD